MKTKAYLLVVQDQMSSENSTLGIQGYVSIMPFSWPNNKFVNSNYYDKPNAKMMLLLFLAHVMEVVK